MKHGPMFWTLLGSDNIHIQEEQVTNLGNYVEELGYSLEGCGFVPVGSVRREKNNGPVTAIDNWEDTNLFAYVLENERTYTVQMNGISALGILKEGLPLLTIFIPGLGPVGVSVAVGWNASRIANAIVEEFDVAMKGMLSFDDLDSDWATGVEVDRQNNKLLIKRGFFQVDQMSYDLNGWTGRYGKPFELSLAFHLSTMAPDFVYNFCLNDDLQTEVHISTIDRNYDVRYYYETEDGTILDKEKVNKVYEEFFRTAIDVSENYTGTDWRTAYEDNTEIPLESDNGDISFPYVSIEVLDDLSTIKFNYEDANYNITPCEWIPLVNYDGNAIQFYNDNENGKNFTFDVKNTTIDNNGHFNVRPNVVEGESNDIDIYIRRTGETKHSITMDEIIENMAYGTVSFSKVDKDENFSVASVGLSMNGLIARINNGSFSQDDELGYAGYDELEYLMCQIDKLIHDINKYIEARGDEANASLREVAEELSAHNSSNYENWSGGYYDEKFTQILESDVTDSQRVNDLKQLRDECKADYEIIKRAAILIVSDTSNILEKECGGISVNTLIALYEFFNGEAEEISTYEPYITSVENHWYKDVYFVDEDDSFSGFDGVYKYNDEEDSILHTITEEYNPSGLGVDEKTINTLQQEGTIYVDMTGSYIEQLSQPKIVQNAPWHYMVKNWMTSGYYFIYDGTVETAEEIESARNYLSTNTDYSVDNPLLIDYDNESEGLLIDSEGNINPRVEEIDSKAKELNDKLKETTYKDGKKYNVRLQKINFAKKSSLAAFSILEGVHTEDGEYVYRDLKEFMIELGYFTEADFETIETGVLDWIIPSYKPDKWPNLRYEKNNEEYGNYIRSKSSMDEERIREKKELEGLDAQDPNNVSGDGQVETNNQVTNNNQSTTNSEIQNSLDVELDSDNTQIISGVEQTKVDPTDYEEEGYTTITTVNGISYKDYKQGTYPVWGVYSQYSQLDIRGGIFGNVGCGATSTAIVLSAYGVTGGVGADALPYVAGMEIGTYSEGTDSAYNIKTAFDNRNIPATVYNIYSIDKYKVMDKALREGRPIIANVNPGSYSGGGHYIVVLGYDENDNLVISNPCGDGIYGNTGGHNPGPVSLEEFISRHLGGGSGTILIPDEAPSGFDASHRTKLVGFEAGLDVITPGKAKVIKIEGNSITLKFTAENKVKNMTMKIEGIKVDFKNKEGESIDVSEGDILESQQVIGETTEDDIKLLMRDEKKAIINNIEDYMKLPEKKGANGGSGTIPLFSTSLSRQEFIDGANNYSGIAGTEFEGKMGEFYDICTKNGINPVIAFTRAIWESGLTNDGGTHNYWGINITNGSGYVGVADSMLGTLQVYCDLLNSYSDPTTWQYKTIMERYNERKNCTENGGCSTSGYGTPDTIEGIMSLYSSLGKHEYGNSGAGGYYYLDPDRAGVTDIYETHEEFVSLCKNQHNEGSDVTVWENAQYTSYQVKLMADTAESLWGERALE